VIALAADDAQIVALVAQAPFNDFLKRVECLRRYKPSARAHRRLELIGVECEGCLNGRDENSGREGLLMIKLKRAYEEPAKKDGFRILVERLWPRGISKEQADIQLWAKEVAPSAGLRKWYGHDVARWKEFKKRYWGELKGKEESLEEIRSRARKSTVTFVYAARDEEHNSALALKEYLEK
jgi:uncharacterized protein YeaO (DUF488 family)